MKCSMVVKAFHDHFDAWLAANPQSFANFTDAVRQDKPGENFEAQKIGKQFFEPRISESEHPNTSRPDEETDNYIIEIRCFIKEGRRGGRNSDNIPDLERLVDLARGAVDPSVGPPGTAPVSIKVIDTDVSATIAVGTLQFGEVTIRREYGISITVGEQNLDDVDLATITVRSYVSGSNGEDC